MQKLFFPRVHVFREKFLPLLWFYLSSAEQFGVCPKAHQLDDIPLLVNPYQQEIALDVALHAALVAPGEHVWQVLFGNGLLVFQHLDHFS